MATPTIATSPPIETKTTTPSNIPGAIQPGQGMSQASITSNPWANQVPVTPAIQSSKAFEQAVVQPAKSLVATKTLEMQNQQANQQNLSSTASQNKSWDIPGGKFTGTQQEYNQYLINHQPVPESSTVKKPETPAPSAETPTPAPAQTEEQRIASQQDELYNQFKSDTQAIMNGTFQLTAEQQADINNLQLKFDALKKQQETYNKNFTGGTTNLEIATGRQRYAPSMAMANIQESVNVGLSKIADIEGKAAEAISQLKNEFEDKWSANQDKKWARISDLYSKANSYLAQKTQTIKDLKDSVNQEYDNIIKQQTIQKNAVSSVVDSAMSQLTGNATEDLSTLQRIVTANPNVGTVEQLYSAIQAKKQENATTAKPFETGSYTDTMGNTVKQYGIFNPTSGKIENVSMTGNQNPYQTSQVLNSGGEMYTLPSGTSIAVSASDKQFMSQFSSQDIELAEQIADYKAPLEKVTSIRGNRRELLTKLAFIVNPNFDITNYGAVQQARKAFAAGGKEAQNIKSLNTAVGHLAGLKSLADALSNSSFTPGNYIKNEMGRLFGSSALTNFETQANAVESEMATVFKNSGATDQEIKAWRANLSSSKSPEQLQGAIDTMLELMSSRLDAIKGTYVSTFNQDPGANTILYDTSIKKLESLTPNNKLGWKNISGQGSSELGQKIDAAILQGGKPVDIVNYLQADPNYGNQIQQAKQAGYSDDEIIQFLRTFKSPLSAGNSTQKVAMVPNGIKGGQCGRFVNQLTGLGLGDSYQNKMSKMDPNITFPQPGMVFVMPYSTTGHTGIILSVNNGIATVKDSNYHLNEKVDTHQIPVSKMTGFRRVNLA